MGGGAPGRKQSDCCHMSFFFFFLFFIRKYSTRNAAHDATRHHTLPKVRALETHPKSLNAHKVARRILQGPSRSSPNSTSPSSCIISMYHIIYHQHGSCSLDLPSFASFFIFPSASVAHVEIAFDAAPPPRAPPQPPSAPPVTR